ncbi:hypothetical protein Pmani_028723 [Petrolisthes manimaculis]|uniref:Macroglobulin domain-containing protein n=1 Tax=Petrolisthes manimaculis TaxID=1843537 RepID=A0AAE1TVD1_9EUCA|nr:hypothetical protein Pmani_028723 [Petrolisthes manimaculis]
MAQQNLILVVLVLVLVLGKVDPLGTVAPNQDPQGIEDRGGEGREGVVVERGERGGEGSGGVLVERGERGGEESGGVLVERGERGGEESGGVLVERGGRGGEGREGVLVEREQLQGRGEREGVVVEREPLQGREERGGGDREGVLVERGQLQGRGEREGVLVERGGLQGRVEREGVLVERGLQDLHILNSRMEATSHYILSDPTYLVVAAREVRAGHVYRLVVNVFPSSPLLLVRAAIYRDNIELAAVEQECDSQLPRILELMIPAGSTRGEYRLRLEGTEPGGLTGSAFVNHTALTFSPSGATLLVQTDKPLYKQGDVVRLRVVALDSGAKMVQDSVDVFILTPRGVFVRRWLSRQCREGPVSLEFPLSMEPEMGVWTVRVEATHSSTQHPFTVQHFTTSRFEVRIYEDIYIQLHYFEVRIYEDIYIQLHFTKIFIYNFIILR